MNRQNKYMPSLALAMMISLPAAVWAAVFDFCDLETRVVHGAPPRRLPRNDMLEFHVLGLFARTTRSGDTAFRILRVTPRKTICISVCGATTATWKRILMNDNDDNGGRHDEEHNFAF
jgi:hypothetical protein